MREILLLAAQIARKHLDLHQVAKAAGMNYTILSGVMNGDPRFHSGKYLPALREAVRNFPTPR